MTMNLTDWLSLALTTAIIAGALVLEHVAVGKRGWPQRVYYGMGVLTDMGLLLVWGAIQGITLDPISTAAILLAACLAGLPDWFVLRHEDRQTEQRWRALSRHNRQLAAELALFQVIGNQKRYSRAHNLLEGMSFLHGGMHQDIEDMKLLVSQLEPLLTAILDPLQNGADNHKEGSTCN